MKKLIAALFAAALSSGLYAAALPDGWRPFFTGPADAKAKCSVTAVKDGVKIVEPGEVVEEMQQEARRLAAQYLT